MSDARPIRLGATGEPGPEELGVALAGKAQRVTGTFVLMIGAGIILDAHVTWLGLPLLLLGIVLFAWGMSAARAAEPAVVGVEDTAETRV